MTVLIRGEQDAVATLIVVAGSGTRPAQQDLADNGCDHRRQLVLTKTSASEKLPSNTRKLHRSKPGCIRFTRTSDHKKAPQVAKYVRADIEGIKK